MRRRERVSPPRAARVSAPNRDRASRRDGAAARGRCHDAIEDTQRIARTPCCERLTLPMVRTRTYRKRVKSQAENRVSQRGDEAPERQARRHRPIEVGIIRRMMSAATRVCTVASHASRLRREKMRGGARPTRHVVTGSRLSHREVASASSGNDGSGGGEDEEDAVPERYRERSDSNRWMKAGSMGSRYARSDVEVTWGMIGVAAFLAVLSTGAVGWLVLTAPSANSPQYRRSDGLDDVVLGLVEEEPAKADPYGQV